MALQPGARLAGYRVERLLGRGGMGEVYLATQERLRRRVALKVLAPWVADDAVFRARFEREAQLAASLDHPNIVPIFEAGEADGYLFLAMRYVAGTDLASLISREGGLPLDRALAIVGGVGSALDAAHAAGLVHRDVKPANILLAAPAEHAYLADFGLSRHATHTGGLTRSGQLVGSADYIAPEQIEGRPVDGRADLYALGGVLYFCLAGEAPYPRESDLATIYAHTQAERPRITTHRPELASLNPVLAEAMAVDPAGRYQSAAAMLEAARRAIDGQRPRNRPEPSRRRRSGALVGMAAAVLVLLVGATAVAITLRGALPSPARPQVTLAPSPSTARPLVGSPTPSPRAEALASSSAVALPITPIQPGGQPTLRPGRYQTSAFLPTIALAFPAHWFADVDQPDALEFVDQGPDPTGSSLGSIDVAHVQVVLSKPCGESKTALVGPKPADLINWLERFPWVRTTDPLPVNIGGHSGISIDFTPVPPKPGICTPHPGNPAMAQRVFLFPIAGDAFHVEGGDHIRLVAIDDAGTTVTFVAEAHSAAFAAFSKDLDAVVASVRFPPQ